MYRPRQDRYVWLRIDSLISGFLSLPANVEEYYTQKKEESNYCTHCNTGNGPSAQV